MFHNIIQLLFRNRNGLAPNSFFLLLNKATNAIVPFLLLPFCNNYFGIEKLGELVYVQSSLGLVLVITDYGFSISGQRNVSDNFSDMSKKNSIFSNVFFSKILLSIIVIPFILLLFFSGFYGNEIHLLLVLSVYGCFVLQGFIPYWFFQGEKKNNSVFRINLISKIVFVFLILFVAKQKKDIYWVPLCEIVSYFLALILSFWVLKKQVVIKFPKAVEVLSILKDGWNVFLIVCLYWLMNAGSIIVVKNYSNGTGLGYYSVFIRIAYYFFAIFQPIIFSLLPFVQEKLQKESIKEVHVFLANFFKYYLVFVIAGSISLLIFSQFFFKYFFNSAFNIQLINHYSSYIMLVGWITLHLVNYFLAMQLLISIKKDKTFKYYLIVSSLVTFLSFILCTPIWGITGTALSLLLGELVFMILLSKYLFKNETIFVRSIFPFFYKQLS